MLYIETKGEHQAEGQCGRVTEEVQAVTGGTVEAAFVDWAAPAMPQPTG